MNIVVCIIITACTTYIGYGLSGYYVEREKLYGDLCVLCGSLKADIGFLLLPLSTILRRTGEACSKLTSIFIKATDGLIAEGKAVSEAQLEEAVQVGGYLSAEEKRLVCSFFSALGKTDAKTQLEVAEGYYSRFTEIRKSCSEQKSKMTPMTRKLGFLAGLIICLFLI